MRFRRLCAFGCDAESPIGNRSFFEIAELTTLVHYLNNPLHSLVHHPYFCCKGTIFFLRFENYCAKIMQYTLFYGSIIVNYLPLVFSVLLCLDSFLIGEIAFPEL